MLHIDTANLRPTFYVLVTQSVVPHIPKHEIRPLTSYRMLAALLVFLFHFAGIPIMPDHPNGASNVFQAILIEGHVGVSLFFVLSGFLITLRYVDRFIERTINIADYVRKRIARIFPLYLVVLLLTLLLNQEPLFVPENLIAFTLTQGFFGDFQQAFVPTGWSLTVEETFYFVAPLVFLTMGYAFRRISDSSRTQILWTIGLLLLWTASLYAIGRAIVSLSFRTGLSDVGGFMANTSVLENCNAVWGVLCLCFRHVGRDVISSRVDTPTLETGKRGLVVGITGDDCDYGDCFLAVVDEPDSLLAQYHLTRECPC